MSATIPPAPFNWSTIWQALKIFIVVVVFIAAQQGMQAFTNTFDWTKLMEAGEVARVFMAIVMGIVFGAMQGTLRAVQILLAIWAGPSVWGYLGPILAGAAALVTNAAAAVVRVFRGGVAKKEPQTN